MINTNGPGHVKIREAADLIRTGQKKLARQLLRELLAEDSSNLTAWELLARTTYTVEEEIFCLKQILNLRPDHPWAKKRLADITLPGEADPSLQKTQPIPRQPKSPIASPNTTPLPAFQPAAEEPVQPKNRRRFLTPLVIGLVGLLCLGLFGFAFARYKQIANVPPAAQTSTAIANHDANCQDLIQKALKASGNSCKQIGSNKACYGNNTIQAELIPSTTEHFNKRGDVVDVDQLVHLSAAPFNLNNQEWGIAIFKVLANLPRSLPGETVTMVVFGNTSLDNQSPNLESFYFSSGLGQIICEKAPIDGIMITVPEGTGISFKVNGAELTLMGNASLTAAKNEDMKVSLYSGSGKVTSNGQDQYFGAGQQVSVQLGGPNGMDAISPPSAPQPINPTDINLACTMTGQYCNPADIHVVDPGEAQRLVEEGLLTPTPSNTLAPTSTVANTLPRTPTRSYTPPFTSTFTPTASASRTFTRTLTATPSRTATSKFTNSFTPTFTRTSTAPFTPTRTVTASNTFTRTYTSTNTFSRTFTRTNTFSSTFTRTNTFTNTFSPTFTRTNTFTNTFTNSFTPTYTRTNTFTDTFSPTYTRTNTFTNTFSLTYTRTNTFTDTFSPTYTRTNTFTDTFSPTYTRTNTFTDTFSPTYTISPTFTITNSPTHTYTQTFTLTYTPTSTPSSTPTDTVTPDYTLTAASVLPCSPSDLTITVSGTNATISLTNSSGTSLTITGLLINWMPGPGNSNNLDSITLDATTLWSGSDSAATITIPDGTHLFAATGTISGGATATLTLAFKKTPDTTTAGSLTVKVTLSDSSTQTGCK